MQQNNFISQLNNINNLPKKFKWNSGINKQISTKLSNHLGQYKDMGILEIDNLIKNSLAEIENKQSRKSYNTNFREEWFDYECKSLRATKFRALNMWRKYGSQKELETYQELDKEFKILCACKKQLFSTQKIERLCKAKDSASFWKAAKEICDRSKFQKPAVGAHDFRAHFNALLNPQIEKINYARAEPYIEVEELDCKITLAEVEIAVGKCKDEKAPGINRIPSEFYKYGCNKLKQELCYAFNLILQTAEIPDEYLIGIIFPLYKKGEKDAPANYRGITFLNSSLKIFTSILHDRLMVWVEKNAKLSPFQAGFRKGFSTVDQIFTLISLVNWKLEKPNCIHKTPTRKVYAMFVDFRTAFDHIQRDLMFYKLSQIGISTKLLRVLKALYKNTRAIVWNREEISEEFVTNFGISRGAILVHFFSLYL